MREQNCRRFKIMQFYKTADAACIISRINNDRLLGIFIRQQIAVGADHAENKAVQFSFAHVASGSASRTCDIVDDIYRPEFADNVI